MEKHEESRYVKRTQKDYTMSFKLQVVQEIEQGRISTYEVCRKYGIQSRSTIVGWLRKFGNFDLDNQIPSIMQRSPEQNRNTKTGIGEECKPISTSKCLIQIASLTDEARA